MPLNRHLAALALFLCLSACAPRPEVPLAAPQGNWVSLFNGKDLGNWTVKIAGHEVGDNYRNTFRVEDGVLKVSYAQYEKFDGRFASLFTRQKFSHYWIRVEYRFVGDTVAGAPSWTYKNSGIQLHSQAPETMGKDQPFPVNVEFDLIGGHRFFSRPTGDVCRSGTRVRIGGVALADKCSKLSDITIRDDQWVTALAEVQGGSRVRQAINGTQIVEYTDVELDPDDADARKLIGPGNARTLDAGFISLQGNGHPVEFRRVEVLPLDTPASPAP